MQRIAARIFIRFLPVLYMALIWFLSSYPSDAIIDTGLSIDALLKESLHLVEFGILYLLWMFAFAVGGELIPRHSKIAAVIAIAYGLVDELHQYFVPSRSATVVDFIKDIIGVAAARYFFQRGYFKVKRGKK